MRWTFYLIICLCTCAGAYVRGADPVHWKLCLDFALSADVLHALTEHFYTESFDLEYLAKMTT